MNDAAQQPNPVQKLLGLNWEAGRVGWSWLKANGPAGSFHMLILETTTGRAAYAFNEQDLEEFIRSAQTNLTGLVLPRVGEVQL